ncbi:PEFG-CTERM sorting domain-containing protein [Nitrosopumilus sp. b2]|uniref:PEFG-CTERM sorting domain-containing protein n=1 Tax=Nitrosopumilus sp. b2 TaxID=2109908 RepID=UPI0015F5DED1|nr:PEFG-CTERM sorting domain-containing protein [Nitrosopumilus sp. b2]
MKLLMVFTLMIFLLFPIYDAYSESQYDINIPSGSSDKNAPFHWSSEKDGDATGFIEIIVGGTIFWKNADSVSHTITSGNPQTGPDGIFDSTIEPGKFFQRTFSEIGEFEYYCTIHPWRTGMVSVVSGYRTLSNVGMDAGDGTTFFDVEYKFNRLINNVSVVEESKSIVFELKGNTFSDDNSLMLLLPSGLINGINSVTIDGVSSETFSQEFENDMIILEINDIPPNSKIIVVDGTTIVPEFGEIVLVILTISVFSLVVLSRKQNIGSMLRYN